MDSCRQVWANIDTINSTANHSTSTFVSREVPQPRLLPKTKNQANHDNKKRQKSGQLEGDHC